MQLSLSRIICRMLLLAAGAFMLTPVIGNAATTNVFVPGNAGPWMVDQNPTFDYGVHNNAAPAVISSANGFSFTAGAAITVAYQGGTASSGYGPNGDPSNITNTYDSSNGKFPGYYAITWIAMYRSTEVNSSARLPTMA
jgi:hypothetical protein